MPHFLPNAEQGTSETWRDSGRTSHVGTISPSSPFKARFGDCAEIKTKRPAVELERNCEDGMVSSLEAALELAVYAGTPDLPQ